jgi:hypothetical protein
MTQLPEGRKPLSWQDTPFPDRPKGHPSTERLEIEKLQERVAELEAVLQGMIDGKVYVAGHGFVETNESRVARTTLAKLKGQDDD